MQVQVKVGGKLDGLKHMLITSCAEISPFRASMTATTDVHASYCALHSSPERLNMIKKLFNRQIRFRFCMQRWDPSIPPYNMDMEEMLRAFYPTSKLNFEKYCKDAVDWDINQGKLNCIPEVVVIGEKGCGKGAFLWSLLRQKGNLKRTILNRSTSYMNFFRLGDKFPFVHFVDTPGFTASDFDASENSSHWKDLVLDYMATSERLKLCLFLMDFRHLVRSGLSREQGKVLGFLQHHKIPHLVILSKKDKVEDHLIEPWLAFVETFVLPRNTSLRLPWLYATTCLFEDSHIRSIQSHIATFCGLDHLSHNIRESFVFDLDDRAEIKERRKSWNDTIAKYGIIKKKNVVHLNSELPFSEGDPIASGHSKRVVHDAGVKSDLRQHFANMSRPNGVQLISPLETVIDPKNQDPGKLRIHSIKPEDPGIQRKQYIDMADKLQNALGITADFSHSSDYNAAMSGTVSFASHVTDYRLNQIDSIVNEFGHFHDKYYLYKGSK